MVITKAHWPYAIWRQPNGEMAACNSKTLAPLHPDNALLKGESPEFMERQKRCYQEYRNRK